MKIFDCFMYFDEDLLLDLRFNILNNYIDKFIIIEAAEDHQGNKRELKFDNDYILIFIYLQRFFSKI